MLIRHSPRIPLSRLWTWQLPTKMHMFHFCRATCRICKNLDAVGVHSPCIWRAFDDNVVHSTEKSASANMLQYGMSKANTRQIQGKHEASPRRSQGKHEASSRQTRGDSNSNTGRVQGEHESSWSWLEVGLELGWNSLSVAWEKFKNSNLKNSDS